MFCSREEFELFNSKSRVLEAANLVHSELTKPLQNVKAKWKIKYLNF